MADVLWKAKSFFNYYINRKNEHSLHSPFVFDLYNYLKTDGDFSEFKLINEIRRSQLNSDKIIPVNDLGAGSRVNSNSETIKLSEVTQNAAIPEKFGKLLFKLIKKFQPQNIIELGTSTGISTLYLALATNSPVFTIEGNSAQVEIAENNFNKANCNNVTIIKGEFSEQLPNILNKLSKLDFAFIDGNHRFGSTLYYFKLLKSKVHEKTILVFDDIHWSEEMEQAWNEIIKDKDVIVSIDFFRLGIVFLKKELSKQHYVLKM